jgi:Domain of Unknown Function (DUF1206)
VFDAHELDPLDVADDCDPHAASLRPRSRRVPPRPMASVRAPDLTGRAAKADRARWIEVLGRVGLVAKGVSYALVGYLALRLALGTGGGATSRQGALATIATHGWGQTLLILLALGFAAYALWRFAETIWPEGDDDGLWKRTGERAGTFGRGLIYAGLTYSALKIAFGSGAGESQNAKAHRATAEALSWDYGTWIVGIAGACVLGAGIYNAYRGATKRFTKRWNVRAIGQTARQWGERAGVVGLLARGVVFGLIGVFVIKAAVDYDPKDAIGLDGALQKLANQTYGEWLLGLTAAGLVAYAVFCFAESRYRRV